jgi:hypothetical protein
MNNRKNKDGGINSFLNSSGILENGTEEEIQQVKKKYWATYKKNWNKAKHKECKSFEILFNSKELKIIIKEAKNKGTSPTNYIKMSSLATKEIHNPKKVGEIRELLFMYRNKLEFLIGEQILSAQHGNMLIEQITEIERKTLNYLRH